MAEEDKKQKESEKLKEIHTYLNNKFSSFYDDMIEHLTKVLNIFEEYFGKDRVELQMPSKEQIVNILHTSSIIADNVNRIKFKEILQNNDMDYLSTDIKYKYPSEIANKYSIKVFEELYNLFIENSSAIATLFYDKDIIINIVVYYPSVVVTNEYDESITINKVFILVPLNYYGHLENTFKIIRSEYTLAQLLARYLFSHVPSVSLDHLDKPKTPCLGTGPIIYTMSTLKTKCDLDLWNLFCVELNNYIHNESVSGGPYISLSNVRNRNVGSLCFYGYDKIYSSYDRIYNNIDVDGFIKYVLNKKVLKFNYNKGCFSIALDPTKYLIIISNLFIEWYNDLFRKGVYDYTFNKLVSYNIISKLIYYNNRLHYRSGFHTDTDILKYKGTPIIKFKNKIYTLEITKTDVKRDYNEVTVLSVNFITLITSKILKIVNYVYTTGFNADYSQTKFLF